ncbi:hypothetical protein [Halobacillus amylolyticus]|uniref:Uncharacterized protein n=1 Tax=Halobacillus amylolyticus TaxID=2932259 RepID=A0ABY4HDY4_9BACI|nr:hypothetical protein [Halobacillus amylolyticus]UOR12627.1 hypothetical protein MUO15_03650 [Halobacillus amylolyticus]
MENKQDPMTYWQLTKRTLLCQCQLANLVLPISFAFRLPLMELRTKNVELGDTKKKGTKSQAYKNRKETAFFFFKGSMPAEKE